MMGRLFQGRVQFVIGISRVFDTSDWLLEASASRSHMCLSLHAWLLMFFYIFDYGVFILVLQGSLFVWRESRQIMFSKDEVG